MQLTITVDDRTTTVKSYAKDGRLLEIVDLSEEARRDAKSRVMVLRVTGE